MKHTREHDSLIDALLAGELLEDDPRARAQLSGCEECARIWMGARNTMKHLQTAEARARRAREAAERGGPAPGEERAMDFLAAELSKWKPPPGARADDAPQAARPPSPSTQSGDATRAADAAGTRSGPTTDADGSAGPVREMLAERRRPRRSWTWLALAASVVLVGLLALLLRPAPNHKDELMGGKGLKAEAPACLADGELRFAWSGEVPAGHQPFAEVEARAAQDAPWTQVWPASIAEQATQPELRDKPLAPGAWIVHGTDALAKRLSGSGALTFVRRPPAPGSIDSAKATEVRWRVVPRTNGAANENAASEWSPPSSLP